MTKPSVGRSSTHNVDLDDLDKILTDLIRKSRFEGWEKGKRQADTPMKYTLSDEVYPESLFSEAKKAVLAAYISRESVIEAIGEDGLIDGSSLANQIELSINEYKAELKRKLGL